MSERIQSFEQFFLYYLREHARPACRAWHYLGTTLALSCLVAGVVSGNGWWFLVGLVAGYGPAWIGHAFVEKNRPATFQYPLWSLISDFRMYGLWISGRLGPWLARANAQETHAQGVRA
jgi:hypothetical protein